MPATSSQFDQAVQAHQSGRIHEAEHIYRNILRVDPQHHAAWHLLGVAAYQADKPREAVDHIGHAVGLCQTEATYYRHLAAAYVALADWQNAREALENVHRLIPGEFATCLQLGQVLARLQSWDEAAFLLSQAVELCPDRADAWHELGLVREHQGRTDDAESALQRSLQLAPANAAAWNQLGTLRQENDHFDDALRCYREAIAVDEHFAAAWANCGSIYQLRGDVEEAAACYSRTLQLEPQHLNAWNNCGVILKDRGEFTEALTCFDKCLTIDPAYAEAHLNRALVWLQHGDLRRGWDEYQWRWRTPMFAEPATVFPAWTGPTSDADHVWIFAEQGLGDEIQFAGCFRDLIENNVRCTIECDPRLKPMFERSFPSLRFVSRPAKRHVVKGFPVGTVQCPVGELPRFFRNHEESFPHRQGYLFADHRLRREWRQRLRETSADRELHIGVAWQGGKDPIARRQRSTTLADWEPLFQLDGIRWWNLQHGSCRDDWDDFRTAKKLGSLAPTPAFDPLAEQESLAALVSELDLVISIDNAVVHLAGALGCATWVLLPFVADWRWLQDRNDSPWYRSLKLVRQTQPADWTGVFGRIEYWLTHSVR